MKFIAAAKQLIILTMLSGAVYAQNPSGPVRTRLLVDAQYNPTPAVTTLLEYYGIPYDGVPLIKLAEDVNAKLHRWHISKEVLEFTDSKEASHTLLPLFNTLGLISEVAPQYKHYDYVVVFGAATSDWLHDRVHYLEQLLDSGITFENLICLTCHKTVTLPGGAQGTVQPTEIAFMQHVFSQSKYAEYFRSRTVWVDTPANRLPDGSEGNINTADTIYQWLALRPPPGRVLAISNQPYVTFQDAVFRKYLPDSFYLETVGPVAPIDEKPSRILHKLARTLYELST